MMKTHTKFSVILLALLIAGTAAGAGSPASAPAGSPASAHAGSAESLPVGSASSSPEANTGCPPVITLDQALSMALANNPDLMNIDERIFQSQRMVYQAWGSLGPFIGLDYQITYNEQEVTFAMPGMGEISIVPDQQETLSFYATVSLIDATKWGAIKKSYQARQMTGHATAHARLNLITAVASTYYQISAQNELVQTAMLSLDNARELMRLTDARAKLGMNTKVDVLRAQQNLLNAQKDCQDALDAVEKSKLSLATLIGAEGDFDIQMPDEPAPMQSGQADLVSIALQRREDYKAQQETVAMAQTDKRITAAKFLPTVDLSYYGSKSSVSGLNGDEANQVVVAAKWSLVEGGTRVNQLAIDESAIRVEQNNLRALELAIKEEVNKAVIEIQQRRRNVDIACSRLDLARESYDAVKTQYEVGLASSLDLSDAFTALGSAQAALVVEQLMLDLARINLRKTIGEPISI